MAERKVLLKYIPPDFDPDKVRPPKRARNSQWNIRMMIPMSIRCNSCGEFIPAGLKLNSRQEVCKEDYYLGLRHYRFYMKCPRCTSEFTIRSNIETNDYVCELNCSPHYTPHWKFNEEEQKKAKIEREKEDEDAIKALENKAEDNRLELEIDDVIRETLDANAQHDKVELNEALDALHQMREEENARSLRETEREMKRLYEEGQFVRRLDPSLKAQIEQENIARGVATPSEKKDEDESPKEENEDILDKHSSGEEVADSNQDDDDDDDDDENDDDDDDLGSRLIDNVHAKRKLSHISVLKSKTLTTDQKDQLIPSSSSPSSLDSQDQSQPSSSSSPSPPPSSSPSAQPSPSPRPQPSSSSSSLFSYSKQNKPAPAAPAAAPKPKFAPKPKSGGVGVFNLNFIGKGSKGSIGSKKKIF